MSNENIKAHIYGLIKEVAAAEKITKAKLGVLSRDILTYVMDTNDIMSVNSLIAVLTPANRMASIAYFEHFLPWEVERDGEKRFVRFGKKLKGTKPVKAQAAINLWLSDEGNNIWNWVDDNLEMKKKIDFNSRVVNAINKALAGDLDKSGTDPLTPAQVVAAIFESDLSAGALISGLSNLKVAEQEEEMRVLTAEEQSDADTSDQPEPVAA